MPGGRHANVPGMATSVVAGRDLTKRYRDGDAALNALRGVSLLRVVQRPAHARRSGAGSIGAEASEAYQPSGQISKCRCGPVE